MQYTSGLFKNISQFLKDVKVELSRVEWPKTDEFIGATIVTLILVIIFTVFFFLVDGTIKTILHQLI